MESTTTPSTLDRAEELLRTNEIERALDTVRRLYGQTLPSSERGRALAIEIISLERLDRTDEAERLVAETMKEEGDDHAFVLAAGTAFSDNDSFLNAEVFLRNLTALDPDDNIAWFNLAISLGREGRYEESARAYDTCLTLNSDFNEVYVQKAYCLEMLNDLSGSAEAYREYLVRVPDDADVWKALGIVESDRRRFGESYTAFQKAAESTDDPEDVYFNWAVTAMRAGDMEELDRCIERLQQANPDGWRILFARADREEAEGHTWPAWELMRESYDAATEDEEDEDAAAFVLSVLLRYAHRHDMRDHAGEVVLDIFERRMFSEEVMEALQALEGHLSNVSVSYQAVLRAQQDESDRYIVYGVSAEDPDEAGGLAVAFEQRCSAADWTLYSIHQLSQPDEGRIGVYWRSEELTRPPGQ